MATREEQKEARRNEILLVALDLFIKKGYGGTRITDIAKAANMSTGLLFHYYESKEKLYEALVELGVMGPQMAMQLPVTDPIEFLDSAAKMIFYYMKESPYTAKVFVLMMQVCNQEPVTEKIGDLVKKITNVADSIPIIKQGQKLGEIRDGDPLALSMAFWGAIQGIAESYAMDPTLPLPESSWVVDLIRK